MLKVSPTFNFCSCTPSTEVKQFKYEEQYGLETILKYRNVSLILVCIGLLVRTRVGVFPLLLLYFSSLNGQCLPVHQVKQCLVLNC